MPRDYPSGQTPPIIVQPKKPTTGRNRNQGQGDRAPGVPPAPSAPRAPGMPGVPAATPGSVPAALVSPEQAVAYAGQLAAMRNAYLTTLAQNRLGARTAVLQGRTAAAGITATRNAGLSQQENAAAGAGRLGGSYDLGQRTGIVAGAAQQQVANQEGVLAARQGAQLSNMQAESTYETGIFGVASDQAAAQASAQADALKSGLFDVNAANYKAIFQAALKRIVANGYGRGVRRKANLGTQTYANDYQQPTYTPGMLQGQFPT